MAYKESDATYALNSYLWKLLEANLGWSKANYSGASPIQPTQQQPELLTTGKSFVIYGSANQPASYLFAHQIETVTYNIYSPSSTEVNKTIKLLSDTFDRQDEAASDVNEWLAVEGMPNGRTGGHRGVAFTSVRTLMSERAQPADEEGGYVAGFIMLEARYVELNPSGAQTRGFTYP